MTQPPADKPAPRAFGAIWLKIAATILAVLLLAPQPNSLPLSDAVRAGRAALAAGDAPGAAQALAAAYARQPWNAAFAHDLGLAELVAGQYAAALQHLTLTARLQGWTPELRVLAGDASYALGDGEAALVQWQTAARDRPNDANLRRRLADAYEAAGKFSQAIDSLRLVAAAYPDEAQVQLRLGQMEAVFDPPAALASLDKAAALDPSLAAPTAELIEAIHQGQARGDDAYLAASVGLAFVRAERYDLAEAAFQRAVGLDLTYGEAYAYLGLAQDKRGEDGGPALRQAVLLAPDSAIAHSLLGLHFRRAGQAAAALDELTRALDLDPENPALAAEIAGAHEALGDYEQAEEWFQTANRLAPNHPDYALLLAQFYVENEIKLDGIGIEAAQRAVELAPESAAARDALGFGYVLLGNLQAGEVQLRQALELAPDLPSANYHMAVLLATRDDRDGAIAHYRRALELDPQGRYGNLALRALALLGAE